MRNYGKLVLKFAYFLLKGELCGEETKETGVMAI